MSLFILRNRVNTPIDHPSLWRYNELVRSVTKPRYSLSIHVTLLQADVARCSLSFMSQFSRQMSQDAVSAFTSQFGRQMSQLANLEMAFLMEPLFQHVDDVISLFWHILSFFA